MKNPFGFGFGLRLNPPKVDSSRPHLLSPQHSSLECFHLRSTSPPQFITTDTSFSIKQWESGIKQTRLSKTFEFRREFARLEICV